MLPHFFLAISYSELDRNEEAQAEAAEVFQIAPHFPLEMIQQRVPYQEPAVLERQLAALCRSGLQ